MSTKGRSKRRRNQRQTGAGGAFSRLDQAQSETVRWIDIPAGEIKTTSGEVSITSLHGSQAWKNFIQTYTQMKVNQITVTYTHTHPADATVIVAASADTIPPGLTAAVLVSNGYKATKLSGSKSAQVAGSKTWEGAGKCKAYGVVVVNSVASTSSATTWGYLTARVQVSTRGLGNFI